jgi:hypothetical protein
VDICIQYAHSVPEQSESRGKVHGYGAFTYAAFAAYYGYFVFDFAHSLLEKLPLF